MPFMEKAGYKIPVCDFRVEGVTSISADTHKVKYERFENIIVFNQFLVFSI